MQSSLLAVHFYGSRKAGGRIALPQLGLGELRFVYAPPLNACASSEATTRIVGAENWFEEMRARPVAG